MIHVAKSIKSIVTWLSVLALTLCLLACAAPTTFGVPNTQWQMLSPSQKKLAMNNYYRQQNLQAERQAEIDKINAKNAPLNNAVSGLMDAIPTQ